MAERLKSRGIGLEWNESVLEALEKEGYSNEFGVREHRVENWIAGMVLPEEVGEGEKVVLRVEQGQWQAGVQGGRQEEE